MKRKFSQKAEIKLSDTQIISERKQVSEYCTQLNKSLPLQDQNFCQTPTRLGTQLEQTRTSRVRILLLFSNVTRRRTTPNFTLQNWSKSVMVKGWVFGRCLECVWKVSGRCIEGVWKVSGRCKFFRSNFFGTKISSGPKFFLMPNFFFNQKFS